MKKILHAFSGRVLNYFFFIRMTLAVFFLSCSVISCKTTELKEEEMLGGIFDEIEFNAEYNDAANSQKILCDRTAFDNVNGAFPDEVYVKTLTQTFLRGYSFVLEGGKIYVKKDGDNFWSLFKETGLPYSEAKKNRKGWFEPPEEIVEIFADCDSLFAFDARGRLYTIFIYKATATAPVDKWLDVFGWPDKVQLVQNEIVRDKIGWAMGARRKDVLWYEDIYGNQHHYGTMGLETIYFLTKNGQEIRFTDSGLPAAFGKSIQGPEDGSFISRNISASASTIFLIGDDGTMYTRLIDFDTMGCDPMFFKYTYWKEEQKYPGTDYRSNFTHWALPNEPWKKQAPVLLEGNARLTRFISIHQNGQGNFARELRVAGTDRDGNTGFYYKQLADEKWEFKKTRMYFSEKDFLTGSARRGQKTEYSYKGYLLENETVNSEVSCSVQNFSLASEGEFDFEITMQKDGWSESKSLKMYNIEMWSYIARENPGFDGSPKSYFVTPVCPDEALQCEHPEMTELLKRIFSGADRELFIFHIEATKNYIELTGKTSRRRDFKFFLTKENLKVLPETYKLTSVLAGEELSYFDDARLVLAEKEFYTSSDLDEIENKIAANKQYIAALVEQLETLDRNRRNSELSRWGYSYIDLITSITFLDRINFPKIETMTSFGSELLHKTAENFTLAYEMRYQSYPYLLALSALRIKNYEEIAKPLRNGEEKSSPAKKYFESYPEYFNSIGIPVSMTGFSHSSGNSLATLRYFPDVKHVPLMLFQIEEKEKPCIVFIELKDSAEKIVAFSEAHAGESVPEMFKKDKIEFKAAFHPYIFNEIYDGTVAGIKDLASLPGTILWDGDELVIKARTSAFTKKEMFRFDAK